jgi:hypothetical protein
MLYRSHRSATNTLGSEFGPPTHINVLNMDCQNRAGSKFGGGGVASSSAPNADRQERLRKLALETIDLDKDPFSSFKNDVGCSFECRLCLTVHQNNGFYLAHTQGKKHQTNLARRAAREQKEGSRKLTVLDDDSIRMVISYKEKEAYDP